MKSHQRLKNLPLVMIKRWINTWHPMMYSVQSQYAMIVDEFGKVITLYPFGPTSMFQRIQSNYAKSLAKEKEEDNFIVSDDYICLGYETDYYLYQ